MLDDDYGYSRSILKSPLKFLFVADFSEIIDDVKLAVISCWQALMSALISSTIARRLFVSPRA